MDDKELDSILNEIKKRNDEPEETEAVEETVEVSEPQVDDSELVLENAPEEVAEPEGELVMEDAPEQVEEEPEPEYQEIEPEADEEEYTELDELMAEPKKDKKPIIIIVAVIVALAIICGVYFGVIKKPAEPETTAPQTTAEATTQADVGEPVIEDGDINPLTGEAGFGATGIRPVSIVVENSPAARPQWGIDSPDIIVEGEVEGGITRMLWIYADWNSVPSQVGPIRSARPSYVRFSTFFDSIFIHWGGSHSKDNYTGGYETISNLGVNDIDGMNGGALFGRDSSRHTDQEHTGVVDGSKIEDAIDGKGYRKTVNVGGIPSFEFFDDVTEVGTDSATSVSVKFSSRSQSNSFSFDSSDGKYHTTAWSTDVAFENVIILMDSTTYITTPYNGSTTTYVNYSLESGTGYLASNGTYQKINWSTAGGVLAITDEEGNTITLNKGNSYIGLASSNNGGSVTF